MGKGGEWSIKKERKLREIVSEGEEREARRMGELGRGGGRDGYER